ncbi:T6SS immunity protein Tdi1 domain-containing protein [Ruminococcus sp.]|uniref:T6SS immunity protein Tdi1 domain-containing protein n=1 Tax=Ruminococcus sp. TaxID=41978 RepID=UPI003521D839
MYYRYGKFELLLKDFDFFLSRLTDSSFVNEFFSLNQYYKAINEHGMLLYKECFGDTTLLALGGKHTTESLKKVQIQEHIALVNSYSGTIM